MKKIKTLKNCLFLEHSCLRLDVQDFLCNFVLVCIIQKRTASTKLSRETKLKIYLAIFNQEVQRLK